VSKENDSDKEGLYPWGARSATYKVLMILLAFNVVAASLLFLTYVEIPFLQGENTMDLDMVHKAFAQVTTGGDVDVPPVDVPIEPPVMGNDEKTHWILICLFVVFINFILVWFTIRISMWIVRIHVDCKRRGWFVWCWVFVAIEWITWIITFVATIITLGVIIVCWIT